jgi:tetratricopeptide (TPR) repeat protein
MILAVASGGVFGAATARAQAPDSSLFSLMQRWGNVEYQMQGDAQLRAFEDLAGEVDMLARSEPENSHILTAQGVILASFAKAKGGLGALDLAKQARTVLEKAITIDPQGEDGSAYVTLGALYQHAPGWPIAFGDDDKARQLLERAVSIRPAGIDTNFYYAQFLEDQGADEEAVTYAQRAVDGQSRADRPSDEALRKEARKWLAERQ